LESSKANYAKKVAAEKAAVERDYRQELERLKNELASSQVCPSHLKTWVLVERGWR
jgi:hypothetical protein